MPAHISLTIKGDREAAKAHAKAHGVILFSAITKDRGALDPNPETHALCGEEYAMAVVRWFLEPPADAGVGTLLSWEGRPTVWND